MHPQLGPFSSYAVFAALAFLAAWRIRSAELRRLGMAQDPQMRRLGWAALAGAIVGAKLGMVLFEAGPWLAALANFDLTGKTVVGGIAGGIAAVELAKWRLGIRVRTGDAWAVAVPVAQAIGRIGCLLHGCCAGVASEVPWAVEIGGVRRHPTQLYEAALDVALAGVLWSIRQKPRPAGNLFRLWVVGYAAIRFAMEFLRADAVPQLGPLTWVQIVCVLAFCGYGWQWRRATDVSTAQTSPKTSPDRST